MKKQISICIGMVLAITLSACGSLDHGRTVVKKGDQTITVLDKKESSGKEELSVKKVKVYTNMNALGWLDEDQLLVTMMNADLGEFQYQGVSYPANNLYLYNSKTDTAKVIEPEKSFQRSAELSPDRQHILFTKEYTENAGSYIISTQGTNEVKVTEALQLQNIIARWENRQTVLYTDSSTGIVYEADTTGKVREIADLKDSSVGDVWKVKEQLYYISLNDEKLYQYSLTDKNKTAVEEKVSELFPSSDPDYIAYTKRDTDTLQEQLIVCNQNFNNQKIVAEDQMISSVKWSPDNTRLLYTTSQAADTAGVNVADLKTGKTARISLNTGVSALSWSPTGKKIAVSQFNEDGSVVTSTVYELE